MSNKLKTPGQIAYEAYCEFLNAKSSWKDQPPGICNAWEAAARAVDENPPIRIVQLVSHEDDLIGLFSDGDTARLTIGKFAGKLEGDKTKPEIYLQK